jgi:DNA-binding MarR family transcriptional regulator
MPRERYPLGENALRVKRLILAEPEISVAEIAAMLKLSTQRIYQIIDNLERRGELREPA